MCDLITHRKNRNEGISVCSKEKHSSIKSLYLGKRYNWEVLLSENRLPTSFLHQNSCHKKTEVNKLKCLEFTLLFMIWTNLPFFFWQHETRVLRVKVIAGIDLAKKDIIGARWASLEILPSPKVSSIWQTDITVCLIIVIFMTVLWKWLKKTNTIQNKTSVSVLDFHKLCQCHHPFHYQL